MNREQKQDNTICKIILDVATVVNGKVLKTDTRPYLGENENKINPNVTRDKIESPIHPTVKTIELATERWTKPLSITGVRELQRHLDIIIEAIYNGAIDVSTITIELLNEDWK